jgi:hypothetical protein
MREQENREDKVRSLVSGYAQALLLALVRAGERPRPEAASEAGGGWTTLVIAFPTPVEDGLSGLTECDRDCLAFLATAREPFSAARLRNEREKNEVGIHGGITVKRSLTKLKGRGLVANSRTAPRGYYLPELLPLMRHLFRQPPETRSQT